MSNESALNEVRNDLYLAGLNELALRDLALQEAKRINSSILNEALSYLVSKVGNCPQQNKSN